LGVDQVSNVSSSSYNNFGLNNTYNNKQLYYYYSIEDKANANTFMNNTWKALGFGSNGDLYNFMGVMDWFI